MQATKSTSQKWPMPTNSNPYGRNRSDRQQPGAITLGNADALGEEIKFYPRRPRLKSARTSSSVGRVPARSAGDERASAERSEIASALQLPFRPGELDGP